MTEASAAAREAVLARLDGLAFRLAALARALHRQPELGGRELHAVTLLAGTLEEEGFDVRTGIAGLPTAFRAERGHGAGPAVAFLVEYDAIPGVGHACGHNLIGAASLGAALGLAAALDPIEGRVVVIGAPGEETIGGKVVLACRGAFDGIDAALLAHPGAEDRAEVTGLASWSLEVLFEGRAAHAVMAPGEGIDALAALLALFAGRDALLARLGPDVCMPGVILEGGVRANVVPARARARFSLRAPSAARLVHDVAGAFGDLVARIARERGARATVTPIDNLYDEFTPNAALAAAWTRRARACGVTLAGGPPPALGSLDTGTVSHVVPALHPTFALAAAMPPTHTPEFTALAAGTAALGAALRAARIAALTGLDLLADPGLVEAAWREHRAAHAAWRRADVPLVTAQEEG